MCFTKEEMKINTSLSSLAQVQIIVNSIPREVKLCHQACNCAPYSEVIPMSLDNITFTSWKYQREYRASYKTMPTKILTTTNCVSSASFCALSAPQIVHSASCHCLAGSRLQLGRLRAPVLLPLVTWLHQSSPIAPICVLTAPERPEWYAIFCQSKKKCPRKIQAPINKIKLPKTNSSAQDKSRASRQNQSPSIKVLFKMKCFNQSK